MNETFLPWIRKQRGRKSWFWQQNNAHIHTARQLKAFFRLKKIRVIAWPAKSPDLSIMEDVWSHLERLVYADGQFTDRATLVKKIDACSRNFPPDIIKNLYSTYANRLEKVIVKKGGQIDLKR